jgi:hypothetical protein
MIEVLLLLAFKMYNVNFMFVKYLLLVLLLLYHYTVSVH